ncbi:MAG: OprO/OprP family phosphate-selective porin, partial [Cellvibrionaceae bacterium]|nr:OprO/OprP family phosphate-selective porin [Cellvibrionaceae bacterium]
AYPAIFAGRDDGLAVWGESGMFKYQLGVFDGVENADNSKLLAARLVLNLLDPETGYYNSSTYYGDKQVLAFGLSHQQQSNVVDNRGDFSGSSIDVLYEQPMSGGTALSLEAAYYNYDYDEVIPDADGGYVLAAFLLAKDGIGGRLQPHLRWQQLSDDSDEEITSKELGINYILDKHNLRMSLLYQDGKLENISVLGTADTKTLTLGMQVQL